MLGLKKGTVRLCEHQTEWETQAEQMIGRLREVFGTFAVDIQHIGSTSIRSIKAKSIIDLAIGLQTFEGLDGFLAPLAALGVEKSAGQPFADIVLFSADAKTGERLYNIQALLHGSSQWNGHIRFRDYLNANPDRAKEYEQLKEEAARQYPTDVMRYSAHKNAFIEQCIAESVEKSCGTIPYIKQNGKLLYLLIRAKDDGYCGFPKGHVIQGETEEETAFRETWEETSLLPKIDTAFRYTLSYTMEGGIQKTVVYFLADVSGQMPKHQNGFEDLDYLILPFEEACKALTFDNSRKMLQEANAFLLL